MAFRFVDDIATADCAVEIEADTLPDLFSEAGRSMIARMTDISIVRSDCEWKIELEEENLERLFYAWLSELVFIKDSENALFSEFAINDIDINSIYRLTAKVKGEKINHARHDIAVDIKAVTMHRFNIEREGDSWKAFVIFDL